MTIQVGMMGTDGIVIASDTKYSEDVLGGDEFATDDSRGCSKIRIGESKQIAVACSGDMVLADRVADALIAQLTPERWENPNRYIREIGNDCLGNRERLDFVCMVGLSRPARSIWLLESQKEIRVTRVVSCVHVGHSRNVATFWAHRYYDCRPIRELMALASLVVVDCARFNSGRISGLEIVYGDSSGFHSLTLEQNRALEREAKKRSDELGTQLVKPFIV